MNKCKFCFIICANSERYLEECLYYIDNLAVPEGYETEKIVIRDAVSMTSGYNRAMAQSDAKYKIYLHQDVLVTKEKVLFELLDIFKDSTIGMLGAVGKRDFMASAEYTLNSDAGAVEINGGISSYYMTLKNLTEDEMLADVVTVDGIFIATQYDLPWDEENFDGWDFYDISQSVKFKQSGYRVVVPCIHRKEDIWIYHDNDWSKYGEWERYRKIFCDSERAAGYEYTDVGRLGMIAEQDKQRSYIMQVFESGDFELTNELLNRLGQRELDGKLSYVALFLACRWEEMSVIGETRFQKPEQLQDFTDSYDEVKYMCRRIYFGHTELEKEKAWNILKEKLFHGEFTMRMLWCVAHLCVGDVDRLWLDLLIRIQEMIRSLIQQGETVAAGQFLAQIDTK